jgi:deoxyribodipyrimidine photo-lyase
MSARFKTSLVWFRRDLRLADNVALARAAHASDRVVCAFVLDPELLRGPTVGAPIVSFFFDALLELRAALRERGSDLALLEGDFALELPRLAERVGATALYYNLDYEPSVSERDRRVGEAFRRAGAYVEACLDHVYFGADEIRKADAAPYTVFTPYKRRWLELHRSDARPPADSLAAIARKAARRADIGETLAVPEPSAYGHARSENFPAGGAHRADTLLATFVRGPIEQYGDARNFPARAGTAHISPHLRAGTIGIRTCVAAALAARAGLRGEAATGCDTWLGELIWRDFYQQILSNYPRVATGPFDQRAVALRYRESESDWQAWCAGRTGYPIVDAAMRQLTTYGWMHNRLRMIVASFLTKDLLLDYRLGERFFERHLADGDKAANNGGWQWSASTGTDAAPYFRVFNPVLQSEKFDPEGAFIKEMLPELGGLTGAAVHAPWMLTPLEAAASGFRLGVDYPAPIVDHAEARVRALALYAPVLGKAGHPVAADR